MDLTTWDLGRLTMRSGYVNRGSAEPLLPDDNVPKLARANVTLIRTVPNVI